MRLTSKILSIIGIQDKIKFFKEFNMGGLDSKCLAYENHLQTNDKVLWLTQRDITCNDIGINVKEYLSPFYDDNFTVKQFNTDDLLITKEIYKNNKLQDIVCNKYNSHGFITNRTYNGIYEEWEYDIDNRLIRWSNSKNDWKSRTYNENGLLVKVTDSYDSCMIYKYDDCGRVLETSKNRYKYDKRGNLILYEFKDGDSFEYEYNDSNLVTKIMRGDNTKQIFKYNDVGQKVKEEWSSGIWSEWEYNDNGFMTRYINHRGEYIDREYNCRGMLILETKSYGYLEEYTYNAGNKLIRLKDTKTDTRFRYID